jgi:Ca2+-binding EF-hand superfamily protein
MENNERLFLIYIEIKLRYIMSKREIQEKELKVVLAKDIGSKNPVFSAEHIAELHAVFSLYADPRQRRADVRDILLTASTLGLDSKYELVYRLLHEIHDNSGGNALDFEGFLKELTARIVSYK